MVDVRTPMEFAQGHVPGAKNYPLQSIDAWWRELPKDKPVYLYNVQGGVLAIERMGYPLIR
mgnify:FL=1